MPGNAYKMINKTIEVNTLIIFFYVVICFYFPHLLIVSSSVHTHSSDAVPILLSAVCLLRISSCRLSSQVFLSNLRSCSSSRASASSLSGISHWTTRTTLLWLPQLPAFYPAYSLENENAL